MKTKSILFAAYLVASAFFASLFTGTPTHAQIIFEDDFESGTLDPQVNSGSGFSEFTWLKNNNTSIVTEDSNSIPVAVWNNGLINNPHSTIMNDGTPRDWTAFEGDYSMRLRYAAGQSWTEQRFDLGDSYPEIWIGYSIRVPTNYSRGTDYIAGANNKWFNLQMRGWDDSDTNVSNLEMQDLIGGDLNTIDMQIQFKNGRTNVFTNSDLYSDFVTPADAGRWMNVVYNLKDATSEASGDGSIRFYRRWENETEYELINDLSNLDLALSDESIALGRPGWGSGYIMGFANARYDVDTEWLLDNFVVSESSLLTEVPEPSTVALLMLGLASVAGCRRCRVRC